MKPEHKDFRKPNSFRTIRTILRKADPDGVSVTQFQSKPAISFVVLFKAYQLLNPKESIPVIINDTEVMIEMEFTSTYIFELTQEEPSADFWCDLVQKTVVKLNESYSEKTKNTYLEKSSLEIPPTMKKDCLEQRRINKISSKN
ncbi:MAG: hypothetical protein WDO71_25680 [Bacteroidota bacterium]